MPGLKNDIKQFVKDYEVCQRNKLPNTFLACLLQPLPVPSKNWTNFSIDFIKVLPISNGYSIIMVVVDRFFKYFHFMALKHPFTVVTLPLLEINLNNSFKGLHWLSGDLALAFTLSPSLHLMKLRMEDHQLNCQHIEVAISDTTC